MKRITATVVALVMPVVSGFAQEPNNLQIRLQAFDNAQLVCKATLLSNNDAALSFIKSHSGTMSDRCECAALLVVSSKSDSQLREMLSSTDTGPAVAFATEVKQMFVQCVKLK